AALRHVFFAERRAGRVAGATARKLFHALIIGAGDEGADLALALLGAGLRVTLADADQARLVPGLERIAAAQADAVAAGRLSPAARDADWARLLPALTDEASADPEADILILTGAHVGAATALPPLARCALHPAAPVVTLGRPAPAVPQAAGLLLVPPAAGGHGAEVFASDVSAPATLAAVVALARRLDRVPVIAQGAGIGAPVMSALGRAARHLAQRHGPAPVEAVLRGWGLMLPNLPQAVPGAGAPPAPDLIRRQILAAMANAGLALLGAGVAQRPSDIDVAVITGRGFPRWEGGPMHWAEGRGMLVLRADLQSWADSAPDLWAPAPLIDRLIHDGTRLAALNDA
ncbi:MAG TPA: 3-hydroxyacyl-CoA dehydrogenase NAD-binding domain-containing protein, partial [Paracoccaceae bacterium]|nr:3-hydroxyacyl-CoA dehydrogenase NAD-binding domain-containing protein [Paracoccaceae bacterium]